MFNIRRTLEENALLFHVMLKQGMTLFSLMSGEQNVMKNDIPVQFR